MAYNSDHFDLTKWNMTIPEDSSGGITGLAKTIDNLYDYESQYFYDDTDGGMVFKAMVEGATTSGTHYARSELRELASPGKIAFWNLATGGTMTATLKVDAVPLLFDGTPGKFVIGQIHGKSDELTRLYWDNGTVYFKNDQSGGTNSEHQFLLTNAAGETPSIAIGEKFSYMIDAHGSTLTVKVFADGQEYDSVTSINSIWQGDTLYFKAGVYLGVNETQGTGYGQASFYGIDYSHTAGQGMGGIVATDPATPPPTDPADPSIHATQTGTAGADTINTPSKGDAVVVAGAGDDKVTSHDGNDTLYGDAGNDILYGYYSNDTLHGGTDQDKLYGGYGNDTLYGDDGDDMLYGEAGDDVLDGGKGFDTVTGGAGHDTFVVSRGDGAMTIADFTLTGTSSDTLVFKGFTADELAGVHLTQSGTSVMLDMPDGTHVTFLNMLTSGLTSTNLFGDLNGVLTGLFSVSTPPTQPSITPTMTGTAGADVLDGGHDNDNIIMGLGGNDKITGHDGNDTLYGGDGNDTLYGYWGDDNLLGEIGNDILNGSAGNDRLTGGAGIDKLTGGSGHDTFVFTDITAADVLTDFDPLADMLDISALGSNAGDTAHLETHSGKTGLYVDMDGAGPGASQLVVTFEGTSHAPTDLTDILIKSGS